VRGETGGEGEERRKWEGMERKRKGKRKGRVFI